MPEGTSDVEEFLAQQAGQTTAPDSPPAQATGVTPIVGGGQEAVGAAPGAADATRSQDSGGVQARIDQLTKRSHDAERQRDEAHARLEALGGEGWEKLVGEIKEFGETPEEALQAVIDLAATRRASGLSGQPRPYPSETDYDTSGVGEGGQESVPATALEQRLRAAEIRAGRAERLAAQTRQQWEQDRSSQEERELARELTGQFKDLASQYPDIAAHKDWIMSMYAVSQQANPNEELPLASVVDKFRDTFGPRLAAQPQPGTPEYAAQKTADATAAAHAQGRGGSAPSTRVTPKTLAEARDMHAAFDRQRPG